MKKKVVNKKKVVSGNLIVGLLFVGIITFLLVFGGNLTGYVISDNIKESTKKLGIDIKDKYIPGEEVIFKITLYDDNTQKITGNIEYLVQDYIFNEIKKGTTQSGEEIKFTLPENAEQGPWKISAKYNDIETNSLFNVGALEKAEIRLEGNILTLKNIGNSPYNKKILIYIGENDQTASVFLDTGQTKQIRLTAPEGDYDIKIIEGNQEKTLEFKGVSLTGNVIGLESVLNQSFLKKYPMVFLFLISIGLVFVIVMGLKMRRKGINLKIKK